MSSRLVILACWCTVLVAVELGTVACRDSGTSTLAASMQRQRQDKATEPAPEPAGASSTSGAFTIEFDATDEMRARGTDGAFVIRAFQVGFFDGASLVRALEIPRDRAEFAGGRVKLRVPLITAPPRTSSNVEVRVRGLSSGPLGQWSPPAGSVSLPAAPAEGRPARARRNADARADRPDRPDRPDRADRPQSSNRRAQAGVETLDKFPDLKAALTPLLRGASDPAAAGPCPTIQDLAMAVAVARKHDLQLPPLCEALKDRANGSLEKALKSLRPSIDAQREIRAARAEARALIRNRQR
jgi:hypothetical protein